MKLLPNKLAFQLKPLNVYEKQQLAGIKQSSQIFQDYSFISFIVKYINETQKDEYNIKNAVDEIEEFLKKLRHLYEEAHVSSKIFHKFKAKYNFYINSGYRNKLLNVRYKVEHKDKNDFLRKDTPKRNDITKITISDELYFQEYIKKQKKPQVVFRGDGRNLNIQNFQIGTIQAEGNPNISFYGVVEHTHTNTAKNGMISTTTDEEQAKKWATGGGKRNGVVYKIILDNYIDVDKLLSNRNFKNRYQGQKEIMSLGHIEASKILSAVIYNKNKKIINILLPAIQYSSPFSIANYPITITKRVRPIM